MCPRPKRGCRKVLAQIEDCRRTGDNLELGKGLLRLSYLVKWVRSDTNESPFFRSHALSTEALAIFRELGEKQLMCRALRAASALTDPQTGTAMLDEAELLATELGDAEELATVWNTRAAKAGMADPNRAIELSRKALAAFERLGDKHGAAWCLFSLAIQLRDKMEVVEVAFRATALYRELGDPKQAYKTATLVGLYSKDSDLPQYKTFFEDAVKDAQAGLSPVSEAGFYTKLAIIARL